MDEKNVLKNRYMHIRWDKTTHSNEKQHIEQHIEQHIGDENSILAVLDTKEISSNHNGIHVNVVPMWKWLLRK